MFTPTPGNRYMSTPFVEMPKPEAESSEDVDIIAEDVVPRRLFASELRRSDAS